jgi:hypothetical protein
MLNQQTEGCVGLLWRAMRPRPFTFNPRSGRLDCSRFSDPRPGLLAPQEGAQMRGGGMYS